jgi:pimeloyl-ACP methyl ester carboxylesterase
MYLKELQGHVPNGEPQQLSDTDVITAVEILNPRLPARVSDEPSLAARKIVEQRIIALHGGTTFQILPNWVGANELPRARQRSLHMHAFIGDLVAAYELEPSRHWLECAIEMVDDWERRFEYPRDAYDMAFHDETVARRLGYWLKLYLTLRLIGEQQLADHMWLKIAAIVAILSQDDFHSGLNNHGMFQDLALLYFCVCTPSANSIQTRSLKRLSEYFLQSVCRDGVHKEHSPAYHFLVADNLFRHQSLFEQLDPDMARSMRDLTWRMGRYGLNILTPELKYPPIGDTEPNELPKNYYATFDLRDATPERSAFFFDGGYAVLRDDPQKRERQTYAVLCASHHGDYHKHQDDLSVLLYAGGWILSESGPYGYDYANPLSKHGYSAAAHSTLMVEGVEATSQPGKVALEESSETRHFVRARGRNLRYAGLDHQRDITVHRSKPLVEIEDHVSSVKPRGMSLLWQLATGLRAIVIGNELHLLRGAVKVAKIGIESDISVELTLGKGQQAPIGYVFPRLGHAEESTVLRVAVGEASGWRCKTTIALQTQSCDGVSPFFETLPGDWPVQYRVEREPGSDILLVVFSAQAPEFGDRINHHEMLGGTAASRLFLSDDFGPNGSYLIAANGNLQLGDAVCRLIEGMRAELGIDKNKVLFIGASQGGTSAIYFANRLQYGHIIAGRPETRLGLLLSEDDANSVGQAKFMFPGENSDEQLNGVIFNLPANDAVTCRIHVERGGDHYDRHVLPYFEHVSRLGSHIELDVGEYSERKVFEDRYPEFLKNTLQDVFDIRMPRVLSGAASTFVVKAWRDGDSVVGQIRVDGWSSESLEYAFYLLIKGEKKVVHWYEESPIVRFEWPADVALQDVSLTGFVREVANPDRKLQASALVESERIVWREKPVDPLQTGNEQAEF